MSCAPRLRAHALGLLVLGAALLVVLLAPAPASAALGDLAFRGCLAEGGAAGCAPVGSLSGATDVAVSPDGSRVYVTSDTDDSLTVFSRDAAGNLAFHSCLSADGAGGCTLAIALDGATGVAVHPDGSVVYVAAAGSDSLNAYTRTASGGLALGPGVGGDRLDGAFDVAVGVGGTEVYVASRDRGAVVPLRVLGNGGFSVSPSCWGESSPTASACLAAPSLGGARGVAVSPVDPSIYVASSSDSSLTHFRAVLFGELTLVGCYDNGGTGDCADIGTLAGAAQVAVSPDGASVYVAAETGHTLTTFSRAPDGALTYRGCHRDDGATGCATVPSLTGARSVAVSPDGASVYVTSSFNGALTTFSRAPDGTLSFRGCLAADGGEGCAPVGSLGTALGVAVAPDGSSVYAAARGIGAITHLAREGPSAAGPPAGGGAPGAGPGAAGAAPRCDGRRATIVARSGLTRGTRRADVILGRAGPDRILGLGGDDVICGLAGADIVLGGPGRDRLVGGAGPDTLNGGPGRDVVLGGAGRDLLLGGPGRDLLTGGPGRDRQLQ